MERDEEYLLILDLLGRVIEANRGIRLTDEKLREAQSLAIKLFYHSATVFHLLRGTVIRDFPLGEVNFLDPASLNVLSRAAYESFLTFHYVFGSGVRKHDSEFRFYSWQLSGLKEREKFATALGIPSTNAILEHNRRRIKECEKMLGANAVFQGLSQKRKNRIMGGQWRSVTSWPEIAMDAGLTNLQAQRFYSYLCDYAHSGSLSVLQVSEADSSRSQSELVGGSSGLLKITMSSFIFEYCTLFPTARPQLEKNAAASLKAAVWMAIGRGIDGKSRKLEDFFNS